MNYSEWEKSVHEVLKGDSLWNVEAYRLSLFLGDIGWEDTTRLFRDARTIKLADQLNDALGSVAANISECFSRGTGRDRARFYEYSLGSARETRTWYFKARFVLGDQVANHRMIFLTKIIRLLLTMVPQQRGRTLREDSPIYQTKANVDISTDEFASRADETSWDSLLNQIPF